LFAGQVLHGQQDAGHVAAGPGVARCDTEFDRLNEHQRDDRYSVGQFLGGHQADHGARHDDIGLEADQLFHLLRDASDIAVGVADLEAIVAAFDVAEFSHAL